MASMAAKMFEAYLKTQEVTPRVIDENTLTIGWEIEGTSIQVFFFFDEDDTHINIRGYDFIKVPSDKYDVMYKALNEVNAKYNFVNFVLNEEKGEVYVKDDAVIQLDTCADECMELMMRMVKIVEDAYPILMKAMWA